MTLLLDTRVLLWAAGDAARLPEALRARIEARGTRLLFSAASLWECALKAEQGRGLRVDGAELRAALLRVGYEELPVTGLHALEAGAVALPEGDAIDRLLVAQARCEGAVLVTADPRLAGAPGRVEVVRAPGPRPG